MEEPRRKKIRDDFFSSGACRDVRTVDKKARRIKSEVRWGGARKPNGAIYGVRGIKEGEWCGWDGIPCRRPPSGERRRGLAKRCRPTPLEGGESGDGAHAETGGGETANTHPKRGLVHPQGSTGQRL